MTELGLGEIQLHADSVGIVEEKLRIAGARHDALAKFDVAGLQTFAHTLHVGCGKGDMIKAPGVFVFLLGAAHDNSFARLARAHQMHGGHAAGIKPIAREIERWAVAVLQTEYVAIEVLGALKVGRLDRVVLQSTEWHVLAPCEEGLGRSPPFGAPTDLILRIVQPATASSLSIC